MFPYPSPNCSYFLFLHVSQQNFKLFRLWRIIWIGRESFLSFFFCIIKRETLLLGYQVAIKQLGCLIRNTCQYFYNGSENTFSYLTKFFYLFSHFWIYFVPLTLINETWNNIMHYASVVMQGQSWLSLEVE